MSFKPFYNVDPAGDTEFNEIMLRSPLTDKEVTFSMEVFDLNFDTFKTLRFSNLYSNLGNPQVGNSTKWNTYPRLTNSPRVKYTTSAKFADSGRIFIDLESVGFDNRDGELSKMFLLNGTDTHLPVKTVFTNSELNVTPIYGDSKVTFRGFVDKFNGTREGKVISPVFSEIIKRKDKFVNQLDSSEFDGITIISPGSGYAIGDTVSIISENGTGFAGTVLELTADGLGTGIKKIDITSEGSDYVPGDFVYISTTTSGQGFIGEVNSTNRVTTPFKDNYGNLFTGQILNLPFTVFNFSDLSYTVGAGELSYVKNLFDSGGTVKESGAFADSSSLAGEGAEFKLFVLDGYTLSPTVTTTGTGYAVGEKFLFKTGLPTFTLAGEISGVGGSGQITTINLFNLDNANDNFENPGFGYAASDSAVINTTSGTGGVIEILGVTNGAIADASMSYSGKGYTVGDKIPINANGLGGSGAFITIDRVGSFGEIKEWHLNSNERGSGYDISNYYYRSNRNYDEIEYVKSGDVYVKNLKIGNKDKSQTSLLYLTINPISQGKITGDVHCQPRPAQISLQSCGIGNTVRKIIEKTGIPYVSEDLDALDLEYTGTKSVIDITSVPVGDLIDPVSNTTGIRSFRVSINGGVEQVVSVGVDLDDTIPDIVEKINIQFDLQNIPCSCFLRSFFNDETGELTQRFFSFANDTDALGPSSQLLIKSGSNDLFLAMEGSGIYTGFSTSTKLDDITFGRQGANFSGIFKSNSPQNGFRLLDTISENNFIYYWFDSVNQAIKTKPFNATEYVNRDFAEGVRVDRPSLLHGTKGWSVKQIKDETLKALERSTPNAFVQTEENLITSALSDRLPLTNKEFLSVVTKQLTQLPSTGLAPEDLYDEDLEELNTFFISNIWPGETLIVSPVFSQTLTLDQFINRSASFIYTSSTDFRLNSRTWLLKSRGSLSNLLQSDGIFLGDGIKTITLDPSTNRFALDKIIKGRI